MLLVRGTQKLRSRLRDARPACDRDSTTGLGDWFATALFWKPQVALLVNEKTFLPLLVPLAPANSLLERIPAAIVEILRRHGVGDAFVDAEVEAMSEVGLAPTNNRSVLGVMNELTYFADLLWKDGGWDLEELSLNLAHRPIGPLRTRHWFPARELLAVTGTRIADDRDAVPTVDAPASAMQLKVMIRDTTPAIWRRLLVAGDATLAELHTALLAALGWSGTHLHSFEIDGRQYGIPDEDDWDPPLDERKYRLDDVLAKGSKMTYVYDFGDYWEHDIPIEDIQPAHDVQLPACLDGRRAGPPEDCGGADGYVDLLQALADPRHPDHADAREWLGSAFDPEEFDPSSFADELDRVQLVRFEDFDQ